MKYIYTIFLMFIFLLLSCKNDSKKNKVKEEVEKEVLELKLKSNEAGEKFITELAQESGAIKRENSEIQFEVDEYSFSIIRNCGMFEIRRTYKKENREYVETLSNSDFMQKIDGNKTDLEEVYETSEKIKAQAFYAEFPFGLNSPTMRKHYVEDEEIEQEKYAKVKVEFIEKTGDQPEIKQLTLWLAEDGKVAFIAAEEKDDATVEFRKIINTTTQKELDFYEYEVYASDKKSLTANEAAKAFEKGELKQKGTQKFKNIKMKINDKSCD